jgi:hypothetical protein
MEEPLITNEDDITLIAVLSRGLNKPAKVCNQVLNLLSLHPHISAKTAMLSLCHLCCPS